jgi:hypothetical protein
MRILPAVILGLLVTPGLLVSATASASEAAPDQTVVRVYDVRITASSTTTFEEGPWGYPCEGKTSIDETKHTWTSLHRGVTFRFQTFAGFLLMPRAAHAGSMTTTLAYRDNGFGCIPPCQHSWSWRGPARLGVSPSSRSGRGSGRRYHMGFTTIGRVVFPAAKCVDYGPTQTGTAIDITRRKPGSSLHVTSRWGSSTNVDVAQSARPTPTKLAFPMDAIYAGKPVTIRVVDTKDETNLFKSFNGVVTIVLTPRGRR